MLSSTFVVSLYCRSSKQRCMTIMLCMLFQCCACINVVYVVVVQSLIGRDRVRECLEKERRDRTDDDIEVLLEFLQHLPVSTRP